MRAGNTALHAIAEVPEHGAPRPRKTIEGFASVTIRTMIPIGLSPALAADERRAPRA